MTRLGSRRVACAMVEVILLVSAERAAGAEKSES
ncbi:hypothetical protein L686_05565 [Stutzerimonas stutzeri MF28]|nr:hypothetical protein L686_05565 [Stutzerimonas stutzeri MF28]